MEYYKKNNINKQDISYKIIIEEILSASSKLSSLEERTYLMGDCGSCPSCACIEGDFQVLAVIEAPATVPIMVFVGGISLTS